MRGGASQLGQCLGLADLGLDDGVPPALAKLGREAHEGVDELGVLEGVEQHPAEQRLVFLAAQAEWRAGAAGASLSAALSITGSSGANTITSGTGADTIDGGVGADTMVGGAGAANPPGWSQMYACVNNKTKVVKIEEVKDGIKAHLEGEETVELQPGDGLDLRLGQRQRQHQDGVDPATYT